MVVKIAGAGGSRPLSSSVFKSSPLYQAPSKSLYPAKTAGIAATAPIAPTAPSGGGGTGGGGGGGGSRIGTFDVGGASAPVVGTAPSAADYQTDPEYLAAKGAYDNVFDQLMATINRENSVYNEDYGKALGNMGWRGADQGGWDFTNVDTAAGRGMKNLTDDFASRGMLRGSGFGEAQNSFQTSLQKQLDSLTGQKKEFGDAQLEKQTQGQTSRDQSINMAAAQALARLSQLFTGAQ